MPFSMRKHVLVVDEVEKLCLRRGGQAEVEPKGHGLHRPAEAVFWLKAALGSLSR